MTMDPIPLEDLALLDVLHRVFQCDESIPIEPEMKQRLIESALVEDTDEGLRLTDAGVAMCKSFRHRIEADKRAAMIIGQRG
ncbi:hypothetical protein FZO89_12335 [Luteimonas viscosa]|uniref:Uncharacterized protein n=1 Tax=Luteimonas viscosa TaxID=1132694 RepID=A0A5D4XSD5_9GAMM|nr:hypothetical protein [Luteimonas viscosa]TYT26984.1 hypothetical protein FZO89_12335 [Luteimonas viscosa]